MLKSNIIGIILILLIIFLCYNNNYETFSNYMILSENQNPVCSMNCCAYTWPVDHINQTEILKKYNPSGIMCDNGQDVGCMCIKKEIESDSEEEGEEKKDNVNKIKFIEETTEEDEEEDDDVIEDDDEDDDDESTI